jgi:hypothetical protein
MTTIGIERRPSGIGDILDRALAGARLDAADWLRRCDFARAQTR